ncbi:cytochrome c oxidase assembly factor 5 [Toxorhynchites rutilus septentrionalis]|uniref:cytochrome c oxidase assembly factor 5 n=1 Tax=Toxorhynchites rutilus septentrionalis TaxID=329112 RepID=UPI002479A767|nr:cytochrome c oxidase assembly factor 5 [Toxorhynchites rutilus septentrionalis]XP_055626785.1 cytochrome c oxidase assembly factor 5 [Toxorhynchites rutilus septentrionalis]
MMRYEGSEELADKTACARVRADLKMCLLQSDCCRKEKKLPRECLSRTDGSVPDECQALRVTFFECKRSMLDNRQRFRGRKGY